MILRAERSQSINRIFKTPFTGSGNFDLFSEITGNVPNEQNMFGSPLASSGTNGDLFTSDTAGVGSTGTGAAFEIGATYLSNGPCEDNFLNLCCNDRQYRDVIDTSKALMLVRGCVRCKLYFLTPNNSSEVFLRIHIIIGCLT